MNDVHYLDTREQEKGYLNRAKIYFPDYEERSLECGDHNHINWWVERKAKHDALDFERLESELIRMALFKQQKHSAAKLHLCVYEYIDEQDKKSCQQKAKIFQINKRKYPKNPKFRIRNPYSPLTETEKKRILNIAQRCGVFYHYDEFEREYVLTLEKIFEGKYDTIYLKKGRVKKLDNWQNMLATFPGHSSAKSISISKNWFYPNWIYEQFPIPMGPIKKYMKRILDVKNGVKKDGTSKAITVKFLKFWFNSVSERSEETWEEDA